jgi:hypothetical protein
MKSSHLKLALESLIAARRPAFIWGPPGGGKSTIVAQVAASMKLDLIDLRVLLLDPVDLRGLPHVETVGKDKLAAWAQPAFLPRKGKGALFLDELNAAPMSTQAACYQLIHGRRLGDYELPDGWAIIAAGNRETDRAVTNRMPSALANRFVHLDYDVDLNDWTKWALGAGVATEVVAFIRFRPELLNAFDPSRKAFPTPRTWEFVSDILATSPSPVIEHDLYAGTVGEGAAAEFVGFLKVMRTLPNPDACLLNPSTAPVPSEREPATLYALASALSRKATTGNFDRVVTYANRLPPEFSVLLVKAATGRDPGLQSTRAFIEWAAANSDVLI